MLAQALARHAPGLHPRGISRGIVLHHQARLLVAALAGALAMAGAPAFAQDDGKHPPPAEMRAELEFSIEAGHFELREFPPASKAIATFPARVIADVEVFVANRDPQFGSTVGFWVLDADYNDAIRLMLSDDDGDLDGAISLLSTTAQKSVELASFNPRLRSRAVNTIVVTRPSEKEVGFTVAGRTRTFKVDFVPAHVLFQGVGVDGQVEFTSPTE
jgi:hypothetical protein